MYHYKRKVNNMPKQNSRYKNLIRVLKIACPSVLSRYQQGNLHFALVYEELDVEIKGYKQKTTFEYIIRKLKTNSVTTKVIKMFSHTS